jgi:acyl-CoA dehydrogenase
VDEEFRPLLDDVQDRIERNHELEPEHPDLTDNVPPHPIKIPEVDRDPSARRPRSWGSGPWVSEACGGSGLDLVERCVVIEELSKHPLGCTRRGSG